MYEKVWWLKNWKIGSLESFIAISSPVVLMSEIVRCDIRYLHIWLTGKIQDMIQDISLIHMDTHVTPTKLSTVILPTKLLFCKNNYGKGNFTFEFISEVQLYFCTWNALKFRSSGAIVSMIKHFWLDDQIFLTRISC